MVLKVCVCILMVTPLSAQVPGIPGFGLIGISTEATQLLNKLQLIGIQAEQVKQYLDQIKHSAAYKKLPASDIDAHMAEFEAALQLGQSISATMTNADTLFRQRYPGYGQIRRRYPDEYRIWNQTAMDTLSAVLRATSKQRSKMTAEAAIIFDLKEMSKAAEGRMQVQQTQTVVAAETLNQLLKLRELAMADLSSKVMYQAMQMQKDAATEAAMEHWFTHVDQRDSGNRKVGLRQ